MNNIHPVGQVVRLVGLNDRPGRIYRLLYLMNESYYKSSALVSELTDDGWSKAYWKEGYGAREIWEVIDDPELLALMALASI